MINDYSSLNLTKLDVLSKQKEIKIGVAYKYQDKNIDSFPASLQILGQCEVVYRMEL